MRARHGGRPILYAKRAVRPCFEIQVFPIRENSLMFRAVPRTLM
jgi:hypothetical protein